MRVNKRSLQIVVSGIAVVFLWLGMQPGGPLGRRTTEGKPAAGAARPETADQAYGSLPVRTKVSDREEASPHYTHSPERLREFMLPATTIDGLSLEEALGKLITAYQEACGKSGETPLPITFFIRPPGSSKKLKLQLPAGNFNTSVQLLATLSGMKASRRNREYRFEPLSGERKQVSQELQVPPDFNTALNDMAGVRTMPDPDPFAEPEPIVRKTVSECLTALGLDLDPSTRVTLEASGKLKLETTSAADAAAISDLAKSISEQKPIQTKFVPKVVEIPTGVEWTPPDGSQMTDDQVQSFMREMSQKQGVELQTLPSISAQNGYTATVEMVREVSYPTDDSEKNFESHDVGKVLNIRGNLLGFGTEVGFGYSNTTVEMNPSSGKTPVFTRITTSDKGFSSDGGTRFVVLTNEDGSRTVILLNSTLIDATGSPIADGN